MVRSEKAINYSRHSGQPLETKASWNVSASLTMPSRLHIGSWYFPVLYAQILMSSWKARSAGSRVLTSWLFTHDEDHALNMNTGSSQHSQEAYHGNAWILAFKELGPHTQQRSSHEGMSPIRSLYRLRISFFLESGCCRYSNLVFLQT